ncbi:MAG: hypothetical protein FJY37_16170 [Betaproteobacteria bacterium]|nr:hypothetical protein [Betaproteobacteria bacterium]
MSHTGLGRGLGVGVDVFAQLFQRTHQSFPFLQKHVQPRLIPLIALHLHRSGASIQVGRHHRLGRLQALFDGAFKIQGLHLGHIAAHGLCVLVECGHHLVHFGGTGLGALEKPLQHVTANGIVHHVGIALQT